MEFDAYSKTRNKIVSFCGIHLPARCETLEDVPKHDRDGRCRLNFLRGLFQFFRKKILIFTCFVFFQNFGIWNLNGILNVRVGAY